MSGHVRLLCNTVENKSHFSVWSWSPLHVSYCWRHTGGLNPTGHQNNNYNKYFETFPFIHPVEFLFNGDELKGKKKVRT